MIPLPTVRRRRRLGWAAAALAAAALAVATLAWLLAPVRAGDRTPQYVTVHPGDSAQAVALRLEQAGLVRSAWVVAWVSRLEGLSRHLTAGVYRLSPGMSVMQMLATIRAGRVAVVRVVIPEGLTVEAVAQRLAAAGIGSAAAVRQIVARPLPGVPPPAAGVRDPNEGYLFPATYSFSPLATPRQALTAMVQTFRRRIAGIRPPAGLNLRQWVTLASIVQAEGTGPSVDREIAAVFLNRLARGMPLDSDATVRYALGRAAPHLTAAELAVKSPYNTYLGPGLPPGPINNPGMTALLAVAHPARVGYLYFVSTPDGRYLFADTYAQHLQNIARLRAQKVPGTSPAP